MVYFSLFLSSLVNHLRFWYSETLTIGDIDVRIMIISSSISSFQKILLWNVRSIMTGGLFSPKLQTTQSVRVHESPIMSSQNHISSPVVTNGVAGCR